MNREIFTMPSAQDVPLDPADFEDIESSVNEDVRKRGNKWCAYVDDKLTKAEKERNPKKYKGKKVGSAQKTPSGKIRMKARACYPSKKKANNAMAAAMMESTVRRVVSEMLLTEEVYGKLATVYHGSSSPPTDFIAMLANDTFRPGEGAGSSYGKGLYTVYDLSNTAVESGEYGSFVYKIAVNLDGFISFEPDVTTTIYGSPLTPAQQAENLGLGKTIIDQLDDITLGEKPPYTSYWAKPASRILKGAVKGIIFVGRNDGEVAVIYDASAVRPIAFKRTSDKSWTRINKEDQDRFKGRLSGPWNPEKYQTNEIKSRDKLMALQEDEATRRMNANLAAHMATKIRSAGDRRTFGRILKDAWRKEADHASFGNVTFVHWNSFNNIVKLLSNPRGRDEISTFPYRTPPLKPFSLGWGDRTYGVILKGHPTIIANADLNSNAFRRAGIPNYDMEAEKQVHREKSSGWNKYPGPKSPGSEDDFDDFSSQLARSWEDHLVYSADEIAPAEKINFNAATVFSPSTREPGDVSMGWPEALLDNWRVEGIVVPNERIQDYGIDEILDNFKRHEVPPGISIYDEQGEERSITR